MSRFLSGILSLIISISVPAGAQTISALATTKLEPAGKWSIEYADWQCVLHRNYLMDAKPAHLALTLEPLSSTAWMRIASAGGGVTRDDGDDAVIFTDEQRLPGNFHYNIFLANKIQIRGYMLDLEKQRVEAVKNSLRLWTRKHGDIEVAVDGFQSAWKATNACMTDLYASFGINEADLKGISKDPEPQIVESLPTPSGAQSADYAFLYWINAEGRIDECRLVHPSGIKKFDENFCVDLKSKAKFSPARDATGKGIRVPRFEHIRLRTEIISKSWIR